MRRPRKIDETIQNGLTLTYGHIELDTLAHEVTVKGVGVTLTRTEFELLQALIFSHGQMNLQLSLRTPVLV